MTGEFSRAYDTELEIEGRRVLTRFVVGDTGHHDLILGQIWFSMHGVLLDPGRHLLHWGFEDLARNQSTTGVRVENKGRRWDDGQYDALHRLKSSENELEGEQEKRSPCRQPRSFQEYQAADICFIRATGFKRHARKTTENTVVGATSIYELSKLIKDREEDSAKGLEDDEDDLRALVNAKLPVYLQDFRDVFSKRQSDKLRPQWLGVDHKIELEHGAEQKLALAPSPLYSMSWEQLQLAKDYLQEHLEKGFIVVSDAQFASPVLFAKKPSGGWRFCVDY